MCNSNEAPLFGRIQQMTRFWVLGSIISVPQSIYCYRWIPYQGFHGYVKWRLMSSNAKLPGAPLSLLDWSHLRKRMRSLTLLKNYGTLWVSRFSHSHFSEVSEAPLLLGNEELPSLISQCPFLCQDNLSQTVAFRRNRSLQKWEGGGNPTEKALAMLC